VRSDYRGLTAASAALAKPAVTAGSILAEAEKAARQAKRLSWGLRKLASEGLRSDLVDQLAQGGLASLPQVEALLQATPAQLRKLNRAEKTIAAAGGTLGTSVAKDLYGAAVQAAKGLVDGLKSQEKALDAQMKRLADVMTNRIKTDLDIHSPSRVFHRLGSFTGQGLVAGIRQQIPEVHAAVGDLTAARFATDHISHSYHAACPRAGVGSSTRR
jgi:hypothetical protein